MGTNLCYYYAIPGHKVRNYPKRRKKEASERVVSIGNKPSYSQGKVKNFGKVHIMTKKDALNSGTVITGTLFLNKQSLYALFDSSATHSCISISVASQLELLSHKVHADLSIGLPTEETITCPYMYKNCPLFIGGEIFMVDLIQFDLTDFDLILRMGWLSVHQAKIGCGNQMVSLRNRHGGKVYFKGEHSKSDFRIISIMKVQSLLRKTEN